MVDAPFIINPKYSINQCVHNIIRTANIASLKAHYISSPNNKESPGHVLGDIVSSLSIFEHN